MLTASMSRNAGGLFESVRHLSFALERQAATDVVVLAGEDEYSLEDRPAWGGLDVRTGFVRGPGAFGWQPGLRRQLVWAEPDVLHLNGLWMYPSKAALGWSRATGRPRIIAPRGMLDPWALSRSSWKKRLVSRLFEAENLRGATVLHALTHAERDAMRAYGLGNPIAILPNGVDSGIASGEHAPPPWAGLVPDGAQVLLFLGRLNPKKGLAPLLRAFARTRVPEMDRWRLVVAGWDQNGHRAQIEALAQELGLAQRVVFTGPLHGADKHAALAAASAFILPSFSEGLPMAVLEAWAFGLPVLMTAACNLPEGFDAHAAWPISTDPEDMSTALSDFVRLPDSERRMMGENGRRLVLERFDWDLIARKLRATCEWAIGGGQAPAWVETGCAS